MTKQSAVSDNAREEMSLETINAALEQSAVDRLRTPGEPSAFSCPACGGVLQEIEDDERVRCRVGHAYHGESALDDQAGTTSRRFDRISGEALERTEIVRTVLLEPDGG